MRLSVYVTVIIVLSNVYMFYLNYYILFGTTVRRVVMHRLGKQISELGHHVAIK